MEITMEQEFAMNPFIQTTFNPYDLVYLKNHYENFFKRSVLKPTYRQKSFYSKAHVFSEGSTYVLRSYKTPVVAKINGYFYRLWDSWSATTSIHVNSFMDTYGGRHLLKSEWKSIPINTAFRFGPHGDLIFGNPHTDDDELPFN